MSKAAKAMLRKSSPYPSDDEFQDSDFNDSSSVFSLGGEDLIAQDELKTLDGDAEEMLGKVLDGLEEKRTSSRETALTTFIKLLQFKYKDIHDALLDKQDTVLHLLLSSLKKEKNFKENILASKAVSLYFIMLGPENDDKYEELESLVKDYIRKGSRSHEVKAALISMLALTNFIASSTSHATLSLLSFFVSLLPASNLTQAPVTSVNSISISSQVRSSTSSSSIPPIFHLELIRGYTLLLTALSIISLRNELNRAIAVFRKGMETENLEVRISSGEGLAVVWEALRLKISSDDNDEIREDSETYEEGHERIENDFGIEGKEELMDLLNTLAKDTTRYRAKKERSFQRSAFRDILNTIESGIPPHLHLKFKKEQVYFETWGQIKQLFTFREALGQGLHIHFQQNPLLRDIFNIEFNTYSRENLTKLERKQLFHPSSEASKARTRYLKKERRGKVSRSGASIVNDGLLLTVAGGDLRSER